MIKVHIAIKHNNGVPTIDKNTPIALNIFIKLFFQSHSKAKLGTIKCVKHSPIIKSFVHLGVP